MAASWKTRMRMEQCARLELKGVPDAEIALHIGIDPTSMSMFKQHKDYAAVRLTVQTGILSHLDEYLVEDFKAVKQNLRATVPAAMQALVDAVHDKSNPKLRMQAAEIILDREGTFTKISRHAVAEVTGDELLNPKDDEISRQLIAATTSNEQAKPPSVN